MKFEEKIYQLRKKKKMSQNELAEILDVSRQTISKWEVGTSVPDVKNLLLISKYFDVSLDYLINSNDKNDEKILEQLEQKQEDNSVIRKRKKQKFSIILHIFIFFILMIGKIADSSLNNYIICVLLYITYIISIILKKIITFIERGENKHIIKSNN